jgi:hypothetical protein
VNRREAEELLPWFVAGTLPADEAQAVQAFIDSGEIAQAELDALTGLATAVAERGGEEPVYDPSILSRAMARLDDVPQEALPEPLVVGEAGRASASTDAQQRPGLLHRLLDTLQWSATPALAKVVVAGQFALLVGLAVMLGGERGSETVHETVAGTSTPRAADFSLSFAPGATEADIRALLVANDVHIVAGPSALGLYEIAVAEDSDRGAVAEHLAGSPLVAYLQEVPKP